MSYGINFPPIHQYKWSGDNITVPSASALQITESSVYLVNSPSANRAIQISDSDITGTVGDLNGISLAARRFFYIYIEAGQYVKGSDTNVTLTPLRAV